MKLLDVVHPAAKTLVDIAQSQDSEVGDGTTTVVLLSGEFLREAKPFIEDGVHPMAIIRAFRQAATLAVARVQELQVMSVSSPFYDVAYVRVLQNEMIKKRMRIEE